MSRYACHAQDCEWIPTPTAGPEHTKRIELLEHATDTGHPVCRLCHLSLRPDEVRTCEACVVSARTILRELVDLYALLPAELGQLHSPVYDRGSPNAADGLPLPSATVLTLLGPGSSGGAGRRLTTSGQALYEDLQAGRVWVRWWLLEGTGPLPAPAYYRLQRQIEGRDHHVDNHPDDPVSISWTLTSWEQYWRELRQDAPVGRHRTLTESAEYLRAHIRWAATVDDEYPLFVSELKQALAQVKQVTGRNDRNLRAPAQCFDCGDDLERTFADPKPCKHHRPAQQRLVLPANDKRGWGARCETPLARELRLKRWTDEHALCHQGGLTEHWKCKGCGRTYEPDAYWLAVRERLEKTS